MSSLARRSLRATAAVAGITVAGIGLAGPAFAAPTAPERSGSDEAVPAPNAESSPNFIGELPQARPELNDLPQLFTVDNTSLHTADDAPTPQDDLPSLDVVHLDPSDTDLELRKSVSQGQDGALQQLDTSSVFSDIPGKLLRSTANNEIRP